MKNNKFTFEYFLKDSSEVVEKSGKYEVVPTSGLVFQVENNSNNSKLENNLIVHNNIIHALSLSNIKLSALSKEKDFELKITNYLMSDKNLKEISDIVGIPESNETEDEFVARSKQNLEKYLINLFAK